jgi:hypothetical protein
MPQSHNTMLLLLAQNENLGLFLGLLIAYET